MGSRVIMPFRTDWTFVEGNYTGAEKTDYNDGHWRDLHLPHDWSIEKSFDPHMPYGGNQAYLPRWSVGWYRKHFNVEPSSPKQRVYIQFDGIHSNSEVWLNGHFVGKRPYGYVSFQYDLTPYIRWDEENVIAVKVGNTLLPPDRWYSGAGIYRNVWLIYTDYLHITEWGTYITTPEISPDEAKVSARIQVSNHYAHAVECTIMTEILDSQGQLKGKIENRVTLAGLESEEIEQKTRVLEPELWSPDHPVLYEAQTTIYCDNTEVDRYRTPFGIRKVILDSQKGLLLNGSSLKLKGVCIHHDLGCLGAAYHDTAMKRRLEKLKEMGCNSIRFAHNPMAPELLDLCDQMGFLVVDEAFDKWKSLSYEHLYDEWWEKDLETMLVRDRNHPSVLMWSVGNEVENQGQPSMLNMLEKLVAFCHKKDPTRPVTCALEPHNTPISLRDGSIESKVEHTKLLAQRVDVLGLNYQEQWYEHYRAAMPDTLILGTETFPYYRGKDNRVKGYLPLNPWFDVANHDYVIGQFVWSGIDYLGETSYPSKGWSSGLIDTCGFRKPVSYLQQSLWSDQPVVHIAVFNDHMKSEYNPTWTMHWKSPTMEDHWTFPEYAGKLIGLVTFTNCESVELIVNEESYGERKLTDFPNHLILWELPYTPGKIRAIGRNGNQQVCEHELTTAGLPYALKLEANRAILPADGHEISHVEVTVIDQHGIVVPNQDVDLSFELHGDGRILGIDNGDLTSDEPYKGKERRTHRGRCLVIVQSGDVAGELLLQASADGELQGEVSLKVE
ncbi:glycoside hydrolase family 2 TIM barrel-domain containing protein [Paenibacillus polymyxa]|uniref:Glycoside hydrolase family 2 n=1 Tax=Paenibacillus polymyxa (strain SC2) TaxID=886882 RepID=E3EGK7_PAEPS|nr:glycoside hydrolase family 2 TIM barrel-domain containing protein [Paenibacillus polymyxa]ADO54646.1 glycoside hydrolase family 2 [Paenibacillus polymyxa SC2]WPQ57525.1 glycoside hydrolase family 2 TIM barrel-domain containing protein [Paenibacillus polymyxa]CCC83553.1 glycoside hydrolase family 2 sugar binding protein [Paenibacillus polymyxa M1]